MSSFECIILVQSLEVCGKELFTLGCKLYMKMSAVRFTGKMYKTLIVQDYDKLSSSNVENDNGLGLW